MKIAFYTGRTRLFNRLVCWFLRGNFSHVELVLEEIEQGSVCASSSFMDGGVRTKVMVLNPEKWVVIDVGGDKLKAYAWLADNAGAGYDIAGLLGFIWRRIKQSKRRFFCNEAVGHMLGERDPWRFDPCSYAAAKGLQP